MQLRRHFGDRPSVRGGLYDLHSKLPEIRDQLFVCDLGVLAFQGATEPYEKLLDLQIDQMLISVLLSEKFGLDLLNKIRDKRPLLGKSNTSAEKVNISSSSCGTFVK